MERQQVADLVASSLDRSGLRPAEAARRAGVSASTLHRILHGQVDPSFGTVREILAACDADLQMDAAQLSEARAAAAARAMLEDGYQADGLDLEAWRERLTRWAGDDPVALVTEAGRASGLLARPGSVLLAGRPTLGRLASAGVASGQRWAVSGRPGLDVQDFDEHVNAIGVLWCEYPREMAQLLHGGSLREVATVQAAGVVVLSAEPQLFQGSFWHDQITYAAPIQLVMDCISIGGEAAEEARKEVMEW